MVRPNSVITKLVDLISVESLQSFNDFDLVSENYVEGFEKPFSDEFNFKSRILTDFSESVSNRVVTIDDFSNLFNNNPRSTHQSNLNQQPYLHSSKETPISILVCILQKSPSKLTFQNKLFSFQLIENST